jgi:hypothetical protein
LFAFFLILFLLFHSGQIPLSILLNTVDEN